MSINSFHFSGISDDETRLSVLQSSNSHFTTFHEYVSLFEFKEIIHNFFWKIMDQDERFGCNEFFNLLENPDQPRQITEKVPLFCSLIANLLPSEIRSSLDPYITKALNLKTFKRLRTIPETPIIKYPDKLEESLDYHYPSFKIYIRTSARVYFKIYRRALLGCGVSIEDLEQEGIFGLNKAIEFYDDRRVHYGKKERLFQCFAHLCIGKRISNVCKTATMEKRDGKKTFHASDVMDAMISRCLKRNIPNYDEALRNISSTLTSLTKEELSIIKKIMHENKLLNTKDPNYKKIDHLLNKIRKRYRSC